MAFDSRVRSAAAVSRDFGGFSLVELLVIVAVIAILGALLFPTLVNSKERARRGACLNNLRQFYLTLHIYAVESNENLPLGVSDNGEIDVNNRIVAGRSLDIGFAIDQHLPLLARRMRTNLVQIAGNERVFVCPNLHEPFTNPGGYFYDGWGVALGYNYIGGHLQTPWPVLDYPGTTWISARKLTDDPTMPVLSDLNTFTFGENGSIVPHTARGFALVGNAILGIRATIPLPAAASPEEMHPARFGGAGGNVGRLDGSVTWKRMRDMQVYRGSSAFGVDGALCLW